MILNFKSFTFNINTNIYKYNSNTIDYEILTFIYNIWHKKKETQKMNLLIKTSFVFLLL